MGSFSTTHMSAWTFCSHGILQNLRELPHTMLQCCCQHPLFHLSLYICMHQSWRVACMHARRKGTRPRRVWRVMPAKPSHELRPNHNPSDCRPRFRVQAIWSDLHANFQETSSPVWKRHGRRYCSKNAGQAGMKPCQTTRRKGLIVVLQDLHHHQVSKVWQRAARPQGLCIRKFDHGGASVSPGCCREYGHPRDRGPSQRPCHPLPA